MTGPTEALGGTVPETTSLPVTRYAALGDSLSEGLGDPVPGGATCGWAWRDPRTRQPGMWSFDRIHPSADGHRLITASVATLLGLPLDPRDLEPRPGDALGDLRRTAREVGWLLRHGARRPCRPTDGA